MNSFGTAFRVQVYGESHGPAIGVIVDGCPAGVPLSADDFRHDLDRRRPRTEFDTPRRESDEVEILSGAYGGFTAGSPLHVLARTCDARSGEYAGVARIPRPGHADFVAARKFGGRADPRGGGHFSGRITLGLVVAGVVAKKLLPGAVFSSRVVHVGGDSDAVRAIGAAASEGDSVGSLVEVVVEGLPTGLGEPFFDGLESLAAHAVFAIPGVRALAFGDGFGASFMRGSAHNDPILDATGKTGRNGAGGVNGGISNGNPIVARIAFKPPASIAAPQRSVDLETGSPTESRVEGRHDACIGPRGAVALEAAFAIVLADLALRDRIARFGAALADRSSTEESETEKA